MALIGIDSSDLGGHAGESGNSADAVHWIFVRPTNRILKDANHAQRTPAAEHRTRVRVLWLHA
ncbi:hypothetical protein, partial [Streptomyces sp. NPDC005093]